MDAYRDTDSDTRPANGDTRSYCNLDLMASYGYSDPNAYAYAISYLAPISCTNRDGGPHNPHPASNRTYILRRHNGQ